MCKKYNNGLLLEYKDRSLAKSQPSVESSKSAAPIKGLPSSKSGFYLNRSLAFSVEYPKRWLNDYTGSCGDSGVFERTTSGKIPALCIHAGEKINDGRLNSSLIESYKAGWIATGHSLRTLDSGPMTLDDGTSAYFYKIRANGPGYQLLVYYVFAFQGNKHVSVAAWSIPTVQASTLPRVVKSLKFY